MAYNTSGLIPGRRPGALNKATVERTEALRAYLLSKDAAYKILNVLLDRLEENPDSIKTADLIKCFQMVQPYLFKTISEEEASDRIDLIMNLPPEQMKAEILQFATALKAV
ncbi:hypothetical protein DFV88_24850 [Salmonella enterica subsp. enterica serovar Newport]|nr:hypothetical protein [Salmonella enterica subsp. enterica serovar Newport]